MKNLGFPNDNLRLYAPPARRDDPRALAALRALEERFPEEALWPLDDAWSDSNSTPAREVFVQAHGNKILLSNRREGRDHRFTMSFRDDGVTYGKSFLPYAEAEFQLPETAAVLSAAADTVLVLGEAIEAYWGKLTPEEAGYALLGQIVFPHARNPRPVPFGLPPLQPMRALRGPEVPLMLGWVNYWSAATCALLGFPDASRDARWLRGAKQGKSGAWVVRLTDEPLDPERNPEHVKALHEAYARFPEVGGRVEPGERAR
jgi:hypothetical protein